MEERRITHMLLKYWDNLRGEKRFPDASQINKQDMTEFWDDCFIVRLIKDGDKTDHEYMHVGDNVSYIYDGDMNDALILGLTKNIVERCIQVSYGKEPLIDESEFATKGESMVKYRQIILPFGPDEHTVDHVLGGMRYKSYD